MKNDISTSESRVNRAAPMPAGSTTKAILAVGAVLALTGTGCAGVTYGVSGTAAPGQQVVYEEGLAKIISMKNNRSGYRCVNH